MIKTYNVYNGAKGTFKGGQLTFSCEPDDVDGTYHKFNSSFEFIDKNGKLLSEEWFVRADYFKDGFADVERTNGEQAKIDKNGNIVSK